jgi:hypothetical protein
MISSGLHIGGGGHDGSFGVLVQSTGGHDIPMTAGHGGVGGHDGSSGLAVQSTLQDGSSGFLVQSVYMMHHLELLYNLLAV